MDKALNILVVEDSERHSEAAQQLLSYHNLVLAHGFDYAMDHLVGSLYGKRTEQSFDVVLTDLMLPQGRGETQADKSRAYVEMAFGYPIALIAAKQGVPYIGIVTDTDHHNSPIGYTFDFLKDQRGELEKMKIGNSILMTFDTRDVPPIYNLKDGTLTTVSPFKASEEEKQNYIQLSEFGYQTSKNWKAALEKLLN